jgi:AcrR family transcriptional regulator
MARGWLREEQPDVAIERILDAAEKAFIEVGVSATGMGEVAETAGCSRGTLYRYFPNRHALHLAYVKREALSIAAHVRDAAADVDDPVERVVVNLMAAVAEVRARPGTAAWFAGGASGMAARMSQSAEVMETLGSTMGHALFADSNDPAERQRSAWIVRVIVSLLSNPAADPGEERAMIERFVAPGLIR